MPAIISSIIIGFLVSIIVFFILDEILYNNIVACIGALLTIICCTYIGVLVASEIVKCDIEKYNSTKNIIEQSMLNDNISDIEKMDLLDKVITQNNMIVTYQYNSQKWYGWYIPDEVMNIELIKLDN